MYTRIYIRSMRDAHVCMQPCAGRARTHPIWQLRPFTVVLSVNEKQRAIDAFRMMQDRDVSGLAVVDANGELSDCISVRCVHADMCVYMYI